MCEIYLKSMKLFWVFVNFIDFTNSSVISIGDFVLVNANCDWAVWRKMGLASLFLNDIKKHTRY